MGPGSLFPRAKFNLSFNNGDCRRAATTPERFVVVVVVVVVVVFLTVITDPYKIA